MESRCVYELRTAGNGRLEGYAAVFNSVSRDLGGFTESIQPGAFARSLRDADNVLALYDHDRRSVLGRVGSGTLKLAEDSRGLQFSINLPDTTVARDLGVLVTRGDVSGASFAFTVPAGGDTWSELNGKAHRTLMDVTLHEITVTANPAYMDTEVAKRAHQVRQDFVRVRLANRYLQVVS